MSLLVFLPGNILGKDTASEIPPLHVSEDPIAKGPAAKTPSIPFPYGSDGEMALILLPLQATSP